MKSGLQRWTLLFAGMLTIMLTACPRRHAPEQTKPSHDIKKMKGDPYVFVKGTNMNGNQPIPVEMMTDGTRWRLVVRGFEEEETIKDSLDEIMKRKPPPPKPMAIFEVTTNLDGAILKGSDSGTTYEFVFQRINGDRRYLLHQMIINGQAQPFDQHAETSLLHTSISDTQREMSFLFYRKKKGHRALTAMNFHRASGSRFVNVRVTSGDFKYWIGAGVKIGWPTHRPVKVTYCPNGQPHVYKQMIDDAVKDWAAVLENRLNLTMDRPKPCPPFSDLQTHTVTFIRDWIEMEGERDATTGITTSFVSLDDGVIVDSDVFLLLEELQETMQGFNVHGDISTDYVAKKDVVRDVFGRAALHEIGHFLGLGHQFDPRYPSIMSYSKVNRLMGYDYAAVRALYQ